MPISILLDLLLPMIEAYIPLRPVEIQTQRMHLKERGLLQSEKKNVGHCRERIVFGNGQKTQCQHDSISKGKFPSYGLCKYKLL